MSEYVKVKREQLENLIDYASEARSLLDDVHCYDTETYHQLCEALDKIKYKEIK